MIHRHGPAWRLALCLVTLLATGQGLAEARSQPPETVSLNEVRRGMLLARADDAAAAGYQPLPGVDSRVRVRVTGPLARTTLRQRFENPTKEWIEAVYAFPLPEDAAVDRMRLRIGERVIEGEIQEREQARKTYEVAREQGKRTALVEQQRPNLFTTDVANIPPGATITVEIEYQHMLNWRDGAFSLRVPMAITPRYAGRNGASAPQQTESSDDSGWLLLPGELDNAAKADAGNATVDLAVTLDPGFALADLTSHHHDIRRESLNEGERIRISLPPDTRPDRDFVLSWQPERGAAPRAAFFAETIHGQVHISTYLLTTAIKN